MNLIQQFPDVSKKMREKLKLSKKDYSAIEDGPYYQSNVLAKYYDREFRKWHFKMLLILATLFGSIYMIVMHSPQIFKWIMSR
jgi:hypothetical protein